MKRIIVGISAADGVSIGVRLLERLREISDLETHLVVSRNSDVNLRMELGTEREKILALAERSYEPEKYGGRHIQRFLPHRRDDCRPVQHEKPGGNIQRIFRHTFGARRMCALKSAADWF